MKELKVIKRDGRIVDFDKSKIVIAIMKAFKSADQKLVEEDENFKPDKDYELIKAGNIAEYIKNYVESIDYNIDIETIQDMVEKGLMSNKRKDVAKAYILYREKRNQERQKKSAFTKEIHNKLMATDIQNSNANMDEKSFGGRKGSAADSLLKQYALDYCMSEMSRNNHLNNEIYIHDLDNYALGTHNCLTIPFDELLAKGFNTRQTDVRPANSVNTAFQLVAVIFQLQSLQQFGGVSAGHLDWTMVPYVRKSFWKHFKDGMTYIENMNPEDFPDNSDRSIEDPTYKTNERVYRYAIDMTIKETQQAAEGLFHNLNTLQSRSGNQLPFTSVNYGTCTLPEGRMVSKALLDGAIKGVGKFHKTPIFPCVIFQYSKEINGEPGTLNYDLYQLALKCTSKRLYPNYANIDWSGNAGYDKNDPRTYFSTMGCRTANGWDVNGFGQLKDGRGNICPVTIVMPTLAMEAKEQYEELLNNTDNQKIPKLIDIFFDILDLKIHEAKDMLIERFNWICSQSPDSAKFMYENNVMAGYVPEEGIRSALKHGTLVIGQIALAETLQILIGKDHTTLEGMELAKKIEQLFKDRCAEFKEEYKLNFGVYYTPAEGLSYTALKNFRKKYGIIPNVSDKEYFTNSIHVPVKTNISPFDKIDIESQLTGYSNAGCITYVELDAGMSNNIEGLETLVNYAMNHDIPYFAINIPVDNCNSCGYSGEFKDTCPECGSQDVSHLRRVTGLSN